MAMTDPQSVTIDSTPVSLNRIYTEGFKSIYASADEELKLTVSHQESKGRTRRMIRIDKRVVAADPLSSANEYKSLGVYVVIDEPEYGFTDNDIDDVVQGLTAWLTTANVEKVLGNQH